MRAYSMDLRERILRDSDAGMKASAVAVTSSARRSSETWSAAASSPPSSAPWSGPSSSANVPSRSVSCW